MKQTVIALKREKGNWKKKIEMKKSLRNYAIWMQSIQIEFGLLRTI